MTYPDKLYNMRSGNNYDSGNYESVNDYLKAIAEGKIPQSEGFAKIRKTRKQILAEKRMYFINIYPIYGSNPLKEEIYH